MKKIVRRTAIIFSVAITTMLVTLASDTGVGDDQAAFEALLKNAMSVRTGKDVAPKPNTPPLTVNTASTARPATPATAKTPPSEAESKEAKQATGKQMFTTNSNRLAMATPAGPARKESTIITIDSGWTAMESADAAPKTASPAVKGDTPQDIEQKSAKITENRAPSNWNDVPSSSDSEEFRSDSEQTNRIAAPIRSEVILESVIAEPFDAVPSVPTTLFDIPAPVEQTTLGMAKTSSPSVAEFFAEEDTTPQSKNDEKVVTTIEMNIAETEEAEEVGTAQTLTDKIDQELMDETELQPEKLPPGVFDKAESAKTETSDAENGADETVATESARTDVTAPPVETAFPDFDDDFADEEEEDIDAPNRFVFSKPENYGDKHVTEKLSLLYNEIMNGLKLRNMTGRYTMWQNYAASTLRGTAGINTGSEIDGRCRLEFYKKLYGKDVISSIIPAEEFTRLLHSMLVGNHRNYAEAMALIREKLDVRKRHSKIRFIKCETPYEAVNEVKRCLLEAQMAHANAVSRLTRADMTEINQSIVKTFVGPDCVSGHTIPARSVGRRLIDILSKVDNAAMHEAGEALIPLTNKALLALLDQLPEDAFPTIMHNGQKVQRISTAAGDIIIGGRANNIYDLDSPEMMDTVCVIDLGGNDTYREGTCNLNRPVFVIIDLHGDDSYLGSKPGIQGGSILGVSMLIDAEGNDTYNAGDIAQGSTIGGVAMLFDFAGSDSYKIFRRGQGHAICGVGIHVDGGGNDKYRAALWAQGFAGPGGFAVLENVKGNDHYFCGGHFLDSYPEHPGYDGWGQGIGAGLRQVANGGIGVILDGDGDDVYEVDYFGHGGGYWLGLGFARDFGGNDIRHGTTKMAYSGNPRRETEWTRFANGFGCHYACGYLFDDAGNDVYGGRIMGTGMAWDLSMGVLCDFSGNARFTATGGMTQGVGAEGSIGILYKYGGNNSYLGRNQGYASGGITYHSPSNCGSNFSFLVDYGGTNQFGSGAANTAYLQRGSQGGYLISRPFDSEAKVEIEALKAKIEQRKKEIEEFDTKHQAIKEEWAAKNKKYVIPLRQRPTPIVDDPSKRITAVPNFDGPTANAASGASTTR